MVSTTRFIGRQSEMETLAERILFSEGGSFLVTGYRGVGKTSFINQVVKKLEDALPWAENFLGETEIVDIYLNVARPVQPSEIMHHVIRRLYDRLIEKGIYPMLDPELKDALTLAYHRTSVNMARKLAESKFWV
jgi:serine/threonine-protein kinase